MDYTIMDDNNSTNINYEDLLQSVNTTINYTNNHTNNQNYNSNYQAQLVNYSLNYTVRAFHRISKYYRILSK